MYREVPGTTDPDGFSMNHLISLIVQYQNQEIDLICEAYSEFTRFICIYLCVCMCVWLLSYEQICASSTRIDINN